MPFQNSETSEDADVLYEEKEEKFWFQCEQRAQGAQRKDLEVSDLTVSGTLC